MTVAKNEIYAAHLYPAEAIPVLLQARELMTQAYNVLDQLLEGGKIADGSPAADAWDRLDQAINMLEPEEEDEGTGRAALHLVVDNPLPEKPS